ncbi:MAG: hypothetical protein IT380_20750 [Myxococcales bacterium]|nr:hypothetical protein [Myxococcales bacterium]
MTEEREPQALLDAIADDPEALGPWRVLADWLLEHGAPHAVLAAYELKLEEGTNDPDLLQTVSEARRDRAQPPPGIGLSWGDASWRCGYITRLVVALGLRYRALDWQGFFAAPQLRMVQWLQLIVRSGRHPGDVRASLEQLWPLLPSTLRRLSVFTFDPGPVTVDDLAPMLVRPRGVKRLDLALGLAGRETVDAVERLLDAGYPQVNLDGTFPSPESVGRLIERAGRKVWLAGTRLTRAVARELDGPLVAWCAPDVRAAVVRDSGVLVPLSNNGSPQLHHPSWRQREFSPTSTGWSVVYPAPQTEEPLTVDLQEDGQLVMLRSGLVRVLLRDELDAAYREVLAADAQLDEVTAALAGR